MSALTARSAIKENWTMDMLACRTKTALSFGGTFAFDSGIYNQEAQTQFNEKIGVEIGGKILAALGK